ncbi:PREDICTED: cyclin-T1-3-like [Nelumbo nucifera]|uniref:Cyclin-T1-3-like n=2 Tax=Nelumbo nucifera TaxID=4432 RepID=A0A1U8BGA3_NELNU|nr:PREDICTED: cyclin-T1-3-like [Nelumbo nucifera]XP_010275581.1 PREDICTED: cyclin-T1-3-like [Nelumbo nucifera]XP_010275582.1 PREDICTED: cyclin-T1-3-like [Nelumbo nucifera]DAD22317.1 TPA_asm: hypothetical protein HUJ06_023780 [Nelumbo nucifera]
MAGHLPGDPSQHGITRGGAYMISWNTLEVPECSVPRWYFTRQELEDNSPSRKDGIDFKKEAQLRKLYCSFIHDLGKKLKVPQLTIAAALMLCHRFYLRQSHAKNEWQTIATVSMFLACKVEETPRLLKEVVIVAYETMYRRDPAAAQRIKQKEVYEKQKELILIGERLLLATIAYDLDIPLPYKPLVAALKRLKISHNDLAKVAWNFVNDWLWTTLCLQYKVHYIAAGSMFLAAKFSKVKLPSEKGKVWWLEFDVSPQRLEEVIQQMLVLLEQNKRPIMPSVHGKETQTTVVMEKAVSDSPQSCVLSGSVIASASSNGSDREAGGDANLDGQKGTCVAGKEEALQWRTSDCGSMNSVVEDGCMSDGEVQAKIEESNKTLSCKIVSVNGGLGKFDKDRIREAIKKRKSERAANKVAVAVDDDKNEDAWIVRELERGIELESAPMEKRQRSV